MMLRFGIVLALLGLAQALLLGPLPSHADSLTSASPSVTSVNNAQGDVTVPTVQRQVSPALDISSGTVRWIFPVPFANPPTCWATIGPANALYVFAQPTISADIYTATINEQAALKALNLPTGLTTIWSNPPAGTTVTLSCVGALP